MVLLVIGGLSYCSTAFGGDLLKEDPAAKKLSDYVPVKQAKDQAKDSKDKDGPKPASSAKSAAAAAKKEEPRTVKSPLQTLRKWWQDATRRPFVLSTVRVEGKDHLPDSRTIQLLVAVFSSFFVSVLSYVLCCSHSFAPKLDDSHILSCNNSCHSRRC
jgi:hypothetical protein